jgi:hypothetical protein
MVGLFVIVTNDYRVLFPGVSLRVLAKVSSLLEYFTPRNFPFYPPTNCITIKTVVLQILPKLACHCSTVLWA